MQFLYLLVIFSFSVYSYVLVDPNITFLQNKYWELFREYVVYLGYYRRDISWLIYLGLVILLFFFHFYFVKKFKNINIRLIAILLGIVFIFSYPFLSHDFFNYMFDARIFTYYGKNPYLFKALDFPTDQWTRFMHWTHRTYPYGPTFLLLSFIPSFLGWGKFALTFILFKGMFVGFYLASILLLAKINKRWAIIFATHPLVIIEGLISSHNDLVGLSLAIIGVYFLLHKTPILGRFFLLFSGGIKYITAPVILLARVKHNTPNRTFDFALRKRWNLVIFMAQIALLAYLSFKMEIQPWYFLSLFIFLPFFPGLITKLNIFFFGLLMSYYPYIRLGGWDTFDKVNLKHGIIIVFFLLNAIYLGGTLFRERFKYPE